MSPQQPETPQPSNATMLLTVIMVGIAIAFCGNVLWQISATPTTTAQQRPVTEVVDAPQPAAPLTPEGRQTLRAELEQALPTLDNAIKTQDTVAMAAAWRQLNQIADRAVHPDDVMSEELRWWREASGDRQQVKLLFAAAKRARAGLEGGDLMDAKEGANYIITEIDWIQANKGVSESTFTTFDLLGLQREAVTLAGLIQAKIDQNYEAVRPGLEQLRKEAEQRERHQNR